MQESVRAEDLNGEFISVFVALVNGVAFARPQWDTRMIGILGAIEAGTFEVDRMMRRRMFLYEDGCLVLDAEEMINDLPENEDAGFGHVHRTGQLLEKYRRDVHRPLFPQRSWKQHRMSQQRSIKGVPQEACTNRAIAKFIDELAFEE